MKLSILIKLSSSGFNEREVAWVENLSISDFRYWASNLCWRIVLLRLSMVFHFRSTEVLLRCSSKFDLRCSSGLDLRCSSINWGPSWGAPPGCRWSRRRTPRWALERFHCCPRSPRKIPPKTATNQKLLFDWNFITIILSRGSISVQRVKFNPLDLWWIEKHAVVISVP